MLRSNRLLSILLAALLVANAAHAADDPCTHFAWDVKRELAVMKQTPQPVTAAIKPGDSPQLALERLYDVQLAAQTGVTFAAKPGKPTLDDGGQAGLLRFKTDKAGRYRISITSGHWIDVIDGAQIIASRDFQGQRGCERPRKIVEYELAAGRDLLLQFSGATTSMVALAITFAPVTAN